MIRKLQYLATIFLIIAASVVSGQVVNPPNTGGGGGGGGNPAGSAGVIQDYATSTTFGASSLTDNGTTVVGTEPLSVPSISTGATPPVTTGFTGTGGADAFHDGTCLGTIPASSTWIVDISGVFNVVPPAGCGSAVPLLFSGASGIQTWLTTPSGANLASALTTPLTAGGGGTGVANTATLTLGSSNQNWATLGTGIVKNTTTTGAITDAASADIVGLFSGCSGTQYLGADGACHTGNSGTVTSAAIAGTTNHITTSGTCTITTSGTCTLDLATRITTRSFGGAFQNTGSALVAGSTATTYFTIPYACTISAWNITLSPADTATIDIWKIATGTAIPTVSNTIVASAAPAISTGTAIHSTTLTGWTTAVAANDIIGINLKAVGGTATQATINVECDQ